MESARKIDHSVAKELIDQIGVPLIEASAKDGTNIGKIFEEICRENKALTKNRPDSSQIARNDSLPIEKTTKPDLQVQVEK
jgi:hypothetical protein